MRDVVAIPRVGGLHHRYSRELRSAHGASKGALHRMAGSIHVELNARGIRPYNIDPGHVPTEAIREILGEDSSVFQMQLEHGTPVEVPVATLVWILTTEEGRTSARSAVWSPAGPGSTEPPA